MKDNAQASKEGTDKADVWRDRLVESRRQQILEAAVEVFAVKGYHRSTIKEIAAEAGIAEGTIYNYYSSKADLLAAMLDRLVFSSLREILSRKDIQNPADLLRAVLKDRIEFIRANRQVFLAVFPEIMANPELRHKVFGGQVFPFIGEAGEYVQRGVDEGQLRAVDANVIGSLMVGAVIGTVLIDLAGREVGQEQTDDDLADQVADVLLNGLIVQAKEG